MILPTKHISTRHSLLGAGAIVIEHLNQPRTVTSLWNELRNVSEILTYERFVLVLDFLYTVGALTLEEGVLHKSQL